MKKTLTILVLLIAFSTAQSQILITLLLGDKLNSPGLEFGLEGGLNLTTISGMEGYGYLRNFNMGFYFDIRLKNQWNLYTGVLVKSNLGLENLSLNDLNNLDASIYTDLNKTNISGHYSHKMKYFLVPVLIKYKFKNHFYAEAGSQFGLMYKSWIEFNSDVEGKDAIIKEYNKDKINKIDAGIMVGLGYTLYKGNGWTVGVKYYYGFIDVYKDIHNTKNSSFFAKLNIPVGVGKKKQTKK